jgi:hypothetical protein
VLHKSQQRVLAQVRSSVRSLIIQPMSERRANQLLLFVSSPMTDAILRARAGVESTFRLSPFIDTWLFESTPASVDSAEDAYLRAIDDCDLFLWLVTAELTEPVAREVARALQMNRPILALELEPAVARSARTGDLLKQVRADGKTDKKLLDDNFEAVIGGAVWQQLVDAWRGKPRLARSRELAMQWQMSRSRLIRGWTQFDVPESLATVMADDPHVGAEAPQFSPGPDRPALLLAGPSGAGKSLLAERLHQQAIHRATADALAAVPLFVRARDVDADLEQYVRSRSATIGEVRDFGVALTLDGLSEIAPERARQLASDAIVLLRGWRGSTLVATSTSSAGLSADMTVTNAPALSYQDAERLVARIAGLDDYSAYFLPDTVAQAMRWPLYAVLLGGFVREHGPGRSVSQAELLRTLATRSLHGRRLSADADRALQRAALATLSTPSVTLASVLTTIEQDELLVAGVIKRDATGDLNFALEIVRAWYAAHGVIAGDMGMVDGVRLGDAWVDVLILVAAMHSANGRSRLLDDVLRRAPAFAFDLVPPGASGSVHQPTPGAIGEVLRAAHDAVTAGLGPSAPLIFPLARRQPHEDWPRDFVLPTLGINISGNWLATGWNHSSTEPRVVEMPPPNWNEASTEWWPRRARSVVLDEWDPIDDALDEWRGWLEQALNSRSFPSESLAVERAWAIARILADEQTIYERPIPTEKLRERLRLIGETDVVVLRRHILEMTELRQMVGRLEAEGRAFLAPPWPAADLAPPVDGRFYTPERLLQRAQLVYETAIEAYQSLVLRFFASFGPRLHHFQIFPARFVGELRPQSAGRIDDVLVAHWQPLPRGSGSEVAFTLQLEDKPYDPDENQRIWDVFRSARPEMRRWPGRGMQLLNLWNATPASHVVYEWLWADLKALKWVEGIRSDWTIS